MGHPVTTLKVLFSSFFSLVITVAFICQSPAGPPPLKITRITPSGADVPAGRQIVFKFDRPVVPLGRMARKASEIPIEITPPVNCQWRWLNSDTLACRMDEKSALNPATRYKIVVHPGITALDGAILEKPLKTHFTTIRPKVKHLWFRTWSGPGTPLIRLTFNQPVFEQSIADHLFFVDPKKEDKRFQIAISADPDVKETPLEKPGTDQIARRVWLIAPREALPPDAKIDLAVTPGLASIEGPEKGKERRVLVSFDTFPAFSFEGVECTDNDGKTLRIAPGSPASKKRCNPLRQVALLFSSPVSGEAVKKGVTFTPDLAGGRADYDPWANRTGRPGLSYPHKTGQAYRVWLPELLRAFKKYHIQSDRSILKDVFGRSLPNSMDMDFMTDHRLPDFVLTHRQAVLEKGIDSEVPLVVTNLKEVNIAYDRLTPAGKEPQLKKTLQIPKVRDIAFKIPLEVRKMLDRPSGVVQGKVKSAPGVKKSPWENWFMAQVTPYQVHVKIGHYNTLVWVTNLATGNPVKGAMVTLYRDTYAALPEKPSPLTQGETDADGIALLAGTKTVDPLLKALETFGMTKPHLFTRIEKGEDLAILPLDGPFRVNTFRASGNTLWPDMQPHYGHMHTWGTTAQGVYRAGDTIQYKLYVRNQNNERFVSPPSSGYRLKVLDPMGKVVHERKDLTLNGFGAAHGELKVPASGAVGWYRFQLSATFAQWTREPLRVLVSDFTPSPFKVTTDLNGRLFEIGDEVTVSTRARLHSGGPYGDAPNRVTALVKRRQLVPEPEILQNFQFDTTLPKAPREETVFQTENRLNDQGDAEARFILPEGKILYGQLMVESAVRDDRGKSVAGRAFAEYAARDRYVGIRRLEWVMEEDQPSSVEVLVLDDKRVPVAGVPVQMILSRRETKAARVKGAGNAYITHYTHQWVDVESREVTSESQPVRCTLTPKAPGAHRVTAVVKDTRGRTHTTRMFQWVVGQGRVVWQERPDNRLEIIPEKSSYQAGERARYLVRNPFPGARALVTIERYGVLKHWVQTLEGSTPVIAFEVEKDACPGFYLSVVVMSPRVDSPPPQTGQVDLGKPSFRMGYVRTRVVDPKRELVVQVKPDQDTYKPGDRVTVKLKAVQTEKADPAPVELAVAVLDESVFDLIKKGSGYFDPYEGFYTLDGLDMENFSLLLGLVGRQKFEKKGADTGGGGGADISLRSVFKFVSYWNPSLRANERGDAEISFKAPDNLTGWRILAMAVTPLDRMGLGQGKFTVNQPTEIRAVMPNQVVAGDRFEAGFSVMNRTSKTRRLKAVITAKGPIKTPTDKAFVEKTVELPLSPFKRKTIRLPVQTTGTGRIDFSVKAWDKTDGDGLTHAVPVNKRYFFETAAQYGSSVLPSVTEKIAFPKEMRTDAGGVFVNLSPTVLGNLEGAFRYLETYPYTCWEQILTKGVMASHYQRLKGYLPSPFKWPDSEKLPQQTLERSADFQAPGGGMTYYIPEDRYVSPYLSAYTALAFTWLKEAGIKIPENVFKNLKTYLNTFLRHDTSPGFYTKGMASTVRAVALAALAKEGDINRADLDRYLPHVGEMSLFGKAHFLLAALALHETEALRSRVAKQILSHGDESSGKMVFSEAIDDGFARILASPLRTNGAVLSALVSYAETDAGKKMVGDVPFKLVRFITQTRQKKDHWENTQANMFCMNGLIDYAKGYEDQSPDMTVRVLIDAKAMGKTVFKDFREAAKSFSRPVSADDPGKTAAVHIEKDGRGRLYYAARLSYALSNENQNPVNAGIEIHREYSLFDGDRNQWRLLDDPMGLRLGDLVRVDLFVSLPAARNFVVVNDPVPGGLEPVNRNLATASTVDADQAEYAPAEGSRWFRHDNWTGYGNSRWRFYHRELRNNFARFYSEYLSAGNYHLSYTSQVIAPGEFTILPAHAEEMYDPELFGRGVWGRLTVDEIEK